jgi:hypothetical protein
MSGTVLVLEVVGISAATIGVVLAQSPPEDLRAWWDRQEWLHRMILPMETDAKQDLSILPWSAEPAHPAIEAGPAEDTTPNRLDDTA